MDSDGLPLVGPGIDYTKVEAINQKRTIAFINHFVTHTARFLNRFSCVCEDKLENLSVRLQQMEISLSLLEAKISSIPGLESVTAPQSQTSSAPASSAPAENPTAAPQAADPALVNGSAPPAAAAEPPTEAEAPVKPQNTVSQDPRYIKYFKMLQFGVPEHAIKGKMSIEGLNPDFLNTPDAPAPEGGQAEDSEDEDSTDASFSD